MSRIKVKVYLTTDYGSLTDEQKNVLAEKMQITDKWDSFSVVVGYVYYQASEANNKIKEIEGLGFVDRVEVPVSNIFKMMYEEKRLPSPQEISIFSNTMEKMIDEDPVTLRKELWSKVSKPLKETCDYAEEMGYSNFFCEIPNPDDCLVAFVKGDPEEIHEQCDVEVDAKSVFNIGIDALDILKRVGDTVDLTQLADRIGNGMLNVLKHLSLVPEKISQDSPEESSVNKFSLPDSLRNITYPSKKPRKIQKRRKALKI